MKTRPSFALVLSVGCWFGACAAVFADDFLVENKIFVGTDKDPRSQSTTIFHEGVVYDYLQSPQEITVLDKRRGRFILLDQSRRLKTELTVQSIAELNDHLKTWAASHQDPLLQFLATPKFEEQYDEAADTLTFNSEWLVYRIPLTKPAKPELAQQYRDFSDAYALLNTRINTGSRPPFARLLVNAAIAKRGRLPKEVHLTAWSKKGLFPQKSIVRTEHVLVDGLVQSDRDRIKQTDMFMSMFRLVDFGEYQKKDGGAAKAGDATR